MKIYKDHKEGFIQNTTIRKNIYLVQSSVLKAKTKISTKIKSNPYIKIKKKQQIFPYK